MQPAPELGYQRFRTGIVKRVGSIIKRARRCANASSSLPHHRKSEASVQWLRSNFNCGPVCEKGATIVNCRPLGPVNWPRGFMKFLFLLSVYPWETRQERAYQLRNSMICEPFGWHGPLSQDFPALPMVAIYWVLHLKDSYQNQVAD